MKATEVIRKVQYLIDTHGPEVDFTMLELDPYLNKLKVRFDVPLSPSGEKE